MHVKNHTLEPVLSSGLSLTNFDLNDVCVSEHKAIFSTTSPLPLYKVVPLCSHIITSPTAILFSIQSSNNY